MPVASRTGWIGIRRCLIEWSGWLDLVNCGQGYDNMHSWTGYGKNWHACKKRPSYSQAGNQNHSECIEWCDNNKPRCDKCSTSAGCGAGYKSIKKFGGRGDNWYACERRAHTEAR